MSEYSFLVLGKTDNDEISKDINQFEFGLGKLPASKFKMALEDFVNGMGAVLNGLDATVRDFHLDEIEVVIEVSTTGSISLIGSIEMGTTGGLTLRFKRNENE